MEKKRETEEEKQKRLKKLYETDQMIRNCPWKVYHEPFQVAEDVYYLGNTFVSSFLIDTGEGLILIDAGYRETLYQLFEAIRELGFDTKEIKYLFLTHAHDDHCAAAGIVQEYCSCRTYIGREEQILLERLPEPRFRVDEFYDYDTPFEKGRVKIHFKHTPGHTPGCTSFLIEVGSNDNKIICGLHGGLGINGLTDEELEKSGFPKDSRERFLASLEEALHWKVDIVLPSHNLFYDMLSLYKEGEEVDFCDAEGWKKMIESRITTLKQIV